MGRSRAVLHPAEDDPNQRSKRKRTVSNVETMGITPSVEGISEGKVALYHCNYCNKDISGRIRMKCVMCPDFDLCVECFSVGAEVTPHKSNHPYRVMDNLSFPLICPDWNTDEEILLLEGIEMYGFGNWTEVAEHVGTKTKSQCIDHYNGVYMNSPCFPLPDMSHVMGKSRAELLAMAKGPGEVKKEIPKIGELTLKEESPFSGRLSCDESKKGLAWHSSSSLTSGTGTGLDSSSGNTFSGVIKKASNKVQTKDGTSTEEFQADRSIGEKKPRVLGDEEPSMTELSGYNFKRQEFEIEYDNDAEQVLADMEFRDTDGDAEHELKLRVLRIYSKRLDERKRRKDFILERNLLYPDPFEKSLSPEEREICRRYRVFMRFHSKEEHDELLKNIIEEQRIVKRIQDLQKARAAGCRTAAEANKFLEQKRNTGVEESEQGVNESAQGAGGKVLQRQNHLKVEFDASPQGVPKESPLLHPSGKDTSSAMQATSNSLQEWDITGFVGADLLSETEKRLCGEIRILPSHYLNMLQIISLEIMKGNVTKKSDAHSLFKVEPSKVDVVYDMLVQKGIAQA
ncbi:transcriptional adapter ADA2-like isoform X1 [Juglans microcarpa x Juglans regia]|uniref:transcriptional adapter ADA2-like isoform X1 n=2 Tax=Juglans microcarpa x Juglans regia TaxID=2249226 RepID=UPI001B7F6FB5|nr:transcriptional adapter ADA2-like isoform X1 [Juglans microcarpa x Juglans regia]